MTSNGVQLNNADLPPHDIPFLNGWPRTIQLIGEDNLRLLEASFHIFFWSGKVAICVLQLPCVVFFHPRLNWQEKNFFLPFFKCLFLIGQSSYDWFLPPIQAGYSIAFQNGMTLENPMKIERFIAKRLRSGIFAQILAKTSGGYFGH